MSATTKCKHCGSTEYQIRLSHVGYRQRLFIVECGECRQDLIPVVADRFMSDVEVYANSAAAWDAANAP